MTNISTSQWRVWSIYQKRHCQNFSKCHSMACLINLLNNGVDGVDGFYGVNGVFDNLPVSLPILGRKFKLLPHLFSCCAKFDANATFLMHFVPTFLAQKFKWMRPNLFWVKSLFFWLFSFKENGGSGEGKLHVTSVKLKSGSKTKFVPTYDSSIPLNPWSKVSMSGYMVSRIKKVMPSLVEKMILRIAHVVEKLE